jgi:extracellular matrix protein 14
MSGGLIYTQWIGPSTSMYFLHSILTSARDSPDGEMVKLLKSFTFTVIPTVNPDGYVFSHDHSRMWRKNRQDVGDNLCLGVDLNSNWGYKWRHPKSSVCSDTYPGRWAFDSPETRAVGWYLANGTMPDESAKEGTTSGRRVRAFIDLHSYGQLCEL